MKFLKNAKQTVEAIDKEKNEAKVRKENYNNIQRFYMKKDSTRQITFLDGVLDDDGILSCPSWNEHQLNLNGHWRNWHNCTIQGLDSDEECPICSKEKKIYSSLVCFFTIIDHSEFKNREGKVFKDQRRLFACKKETYARLTFKAQKNGGLVGCTFDVARLGDKSAGVGDEFEFVCQSRKKELMEKYDMVADGEKDDHKVCKAYDYEEILKYNNAQELRDLGVASDSSTAGTSFSSNSSVSTSKPASSDSFDDEL